MPEVWQIGFQDPATPVLEGIIYFHNDLWFFLIIISTLVFWMLFRCIFVYSNTKNITPSKIVHGTLIEIIWTIIPAVVLFFVAIPSFALLYSMDEMIDPQITIKAVGHQWYWHYEYYDESIETNKSINAKFINFESYLLPQSELSSTDIRLLSVTRTLLLPIKTHVRLLVTSADVLHSWAVPSFGVKVDACPGRLNQTSIYIKRVGNYFGQCSEICGVNHGFMPIAVEAVNPWQFKSLFV